MAKEKEFDYTQQAEGALVNGTIVEKCSSQYGDRNKNGALATIVGSVKISEEVQKDAKIKFPDLPAADYLYFVNFLDEAEDIIGAVADFKLKIV